MANELTEMISVVFSVEQVRAMKYEADRDNRKLGNWIRTTIDRHLEALGTYEKLRIEDQAREEAAASQSQE